MTKEEIIEMAKQAGAMFDHMTWVERDLLPVFERFAKLVAQHEREACAKVCDDINANYKWPDSVAEKVASEWCADRIRARDARKPTEGA